MNRVTTRLMSKETAISRDGITAEYKNWDKKRDDDGNFQSWHII
jgi:hypothetical protein